MFTGGAPKRLGKDDIDFPLDDSDKRNSSWGHELLQPQVSTTAAMPPSTPRSLGWCQHVACRCCWLQIELKRLNYLKRMIWHFQPTDWWFKSNCDITWRRSMVNHDPELKTYAYELQNGCWRLIAQEYQTYNLCIRIKDKLIRDFCRLQVASTWLFCWSEDSRANPTSFIQHSGEIQEHPIHVYSIMYIYIYSLFPGKALCLELRSTCKQLQTSNQVLSHPFTSTV